MNPIEAILNEAKNNKWPYPKTFQLLKNAGVESYSVWFTDAFNATYKGSFGLWHESAPAGYTPSVLANQFFVAGIKQVLQDHTAGKTNYVQFLGELAGQGVSHYKVNMLNDTVTYFNDDETGLLQEYVPLWEE